MITLRDYQLDLSDRLRAEVARIPDGKRRVILQAETGSGKMVISCDLIRRCHEKGLRALFIARGREIVNQASATLWEMGVPHGIIMAGEDCPPARVFVCSKDTLWSRAVKRRCMTMPQADLVIVDEAHESLARSWQKILDFYSHAVLIGPTATPARPNGRGLGGLWQAMVQCVPPSRLIAGGWIVPCRAFAPYVPDLKGLPVGKDGDYIRQELSKLMDKAQLTGNIVRTWRELASDRPTVVYACDLQHAKHLRDEFADAGVSVEYLDGDMPADLRDGIVQRATSGQTQVVVNVLVLRQGVDIPRLSCAVLARPTRSFVFFRQAVGRVKRPFPGKADALVIDHAGAVYAHGLPDDDVEWTLSPSERIEDLRERKNGGRKPLRCPKCHCMFSGTNICPNCHFELKRLPKVREAEPGKLIEVTAADPFILHEDRVRYWHKCLATAAHRGRTCAAAAMMYEARMGAPPWKHSGLPNMPGRDQWKVPAADLFPQYVRARA